MTATSPSIAPAIKGVWQKVIPLVTAKRVAWIVLAFGIALRAAAYLFNPSLYVDEGAIALNIINRSFAGLFHPLDHNQAAPVGFLLFEKLAVTMFGDSEYALRLFPFLFSIASLFLFYSVARRVLRGWAAAAALLFFAVSSQAIYYAVQVKQYSGDVALTLLIVLAGLHLESKELTLRRAALFSMLGIVAVWISHPSVFVLAGVGTTLALVAMKRREWARLWKIAVCCALWVLSFAAFFMISLGHLGENQRLESSWMKKGTFMPLPPATLSDLEWFPDTFFKLFSNPGDSPFPFVAGLMFIVGCLALLFKRRAHLLMLISPILITLLASGLHKYPFGRRLLLFALPLMLIIIAAGVEFIVERARPFAALTGFLIFEILLYQFISGGASVPSWKRLLLFIAVTGLMIVAAAVLYVMDKGRVYSAALGGLILAFLLVQPVGGEINNARRPQARQEIRPMMSYVQTHKQPGDMTYVYHHQKESFLYYAPKHGLNAGEYVLGTDFREHWKDADNDAYKKELEQFRGRGRVWALFSHVRSQGGVNEEDYIVKYLDSIGRRLDKFKQGTAAAYLYDLSHPAGNDPTAKWDVAAAN